MRPNPEIAEAQGQPTTDLKGEKMPDIVNPRSPFMASQIARMREIIAGANDPVDRGLAVRTWIHWLLADVQSNPARYSNGDTLDIIRDAATEFQMDYKFQRASNQPHIIIVLVKAKEERWNYELNNGVVNVEGLDNQYMGYVDRSHGAQTVQGSKA